MGDRILSSVPSHFVAGASCSKTASPIKPGGDGKKFGRIRWLSGLVNVERAARRFGTLVVYASHPLRKVALPGLFVGLDEYGLVLHSVVMKIRGEVPFGILVR